MGFGECLLDHLSVACSIPKIFDAYIGCGRIEPKLNEAMMLTVNSVNDCPFCTGLHGQLARMAGVEEAVPLLQADSLEVAKSCGPTASQNCEAIAYARTFGEGNGRGPLEADAYRRLAESYGPKKASSLRALCWFLLWGSLGGNTVNAFWKGRLRCQPKIGSSPIFELFFFLVYGPLFLVIAIVNALLRYFPQVPTWFSAFFGAFLTVVASIWIIPVAAVGVLLFPCLPRGK